MEGLVMLLLLESTLCSVLWGAAVVVGMALQWGPEVSPTCFPCKNRPGTALSLTDHVTPPAQQHPQPPDPQPWGASCKLLSLGTARSSRVLVSAQSSAWEPREAQPGKGPRVPPLSLAAPWSHIPVPVPLYEQHPWVPRGWDGGLGMGAQVPPRVTAVGMRMASSASQVQFLP